MKGIYKKILLKREAGKKMIAVLLDPDQCRGMVLAATIATLKTNVPDFIFVGGSHTTACIESLIEVLKEETSASIVLFPGNALQFSANADAMLYLSLLSGRNAEYLIGQHISSAIAIKKTKVEVIPTGYLLVDGGKPTSVEYISNTRPIPRDKNQIALSTAVAAELLGMRLVYLEAGSGALMPVAPEMISCVRNGLALPLIVGGGIRSVLQLQDAYKAGADLVVVGNVFEENPKLIADFVDCARAFDASIED